MMTVSSPMVQSILLRIAPTNRNWQYFDTIPVIDSTIHFPETCINVDFVSLPAHERDQVGGLMIEILGNFR